MANKTRVQMMTMASGPDWQARPGEEIDLPTATAEALIEGGYARRVDSASEPPPAAPEAEDDANDEDWTSTPEEAVRADTKKEAPMETATAGPQRSSEADDQVAAEKAGREAAEAGKPRSANPHDRRTTLGRAWDRGHEAGLAE